MVKKGCLAILFSCVVMLAVGCEKANLTQLGEEQIEKGAAVDEGATSGGSINVATIAVRAADGKAVNFSAEIATSEEERKHGLMGRESLAKNYGMWFVFPSDVRDAFWMKDTLVALDIIFVGSDMKVVDIIANAEPNSEKLLEPKAPYRYVLEVAAGSAAAGNIAIGDTAEQRIGPAQ